MAPTRRKELLNMVYHKGQSWYLYFSSSILMIYLCIYHQILQNVICLRMTPHFIQQEKALCKYQKTLQLCLDCISVWCNTNHMLNNPVKTKSVVITTQQKHQLSDFNEIVIWWSKYWKCNWTSPTRSHCWQQVSMASPDRTHNYAKARPKNCFFFLNCNISSNRYQKYLLQCSYKTSRGLCVSGVGWLWRSTLKRNWTRKSSLTINEYLRIKFLIIILIPQTPLHNSSLVTSPTTLTPGITSTCQGQGLTCLKLAYPSLERSSETPCLKT